VQALDDRKESYEQLLVKHQALAVAHEALQSELQALQNRDDGGSESSYVVVLMDAHSHKVNPPFEFQVLDLTAVQSLDNLAHGYTGGGSKAANLLKKAILQQLDQLGCDVSPAFGDRIVVRVYINLRGLSGEEQDSSASREMAAFAAGFSREELSYDFVDVGDYNVVQNKTIGKHS
jgi:hypothetical protein